jgi:thioredoxin-related protein
MSLINHGSTRRAWMAMGAGALAFGLSPRAWAANAVLPASQSLPEELEKALKAGQPLVVMVSLEGCPFCRVARNHYLDPLRQRDGGHVVQIDMRTTTPVRDFNGAAATHDALVRAWGIKIAPTVLFFGPRGKEIAERLEGGYIPDFYGAYLEHRMQTARTLVR